ncbi:hypothetical protein C8F01DRAFT_1133909 [Mycena amicta]|nr:hypothetical protein C8F01DRAFT_1133909 [Mycena amicta]
MSEAAPYFDVGPMTIPLFVGTILNWCLLGSLVVQVIIYFTAFPRDPKLSKLLVGLVCIVETLQTLSDTRDTSRTFGARWGDFTVLDDVGWSWFSVPIIGSTIACAGQLFFAWRIYIIGRSLVMPVIITILTVFQFGAGIWSGIDIARAGRYSLLQFSSFKVPVAWLSATALCDLVIVASTCYYLLKNRRPGFNPSTTALISRIIKITVETGLVCAVYALLDLSLFVAFKGNSSHLAVCIELSKVYSNSILAILNSRVSFGHSAATTNVVHSGMSSAPSDVVFKAIQRTAASETVHASSLTYGGGYSGSRSLGDLEKDVGLAI